MNRTLFGQFESWALELQALSHTLRRDGAITDALELDEQVQSYRQVLRIVSDVGSLATKPTVSERQCARRSIDLLSQGCIETNRHGIIRRANRAASRLLNLPSSFMSGQPLLVFIAKEDRRAFLSGFMTLRHSDGAALQHYLVRCKPLHDVIFLAAFTCERVEDPTEQVVGLVWLFSPATPSLDPGAHLPKGPDHDGC
jgi:PAS domain-containing protein